METPRIKFYNLSLAERASWIAKQTGLSEDDLSALTGPGGLSMEQADHMIENVVGMHALPLGIAQNFIINGREVLVPMAIEEPSVVAGASFMARLARSGGGFIAHSTPPEMIGQMQILNVENPSLARMLLLERESELLEIASRTDPVLSRYGGGPRGLEVRIIDKSPIGPFLVLHLIIDVRDAMGANAINTAMERLAPRVEEITGGKVHLRILSNLADRRLARARCTIKLSELAFGEYTAEAVRDGIIAAWAFAAADPYRAATHNKGIMNGVDAVVIATGNDWRAVEAGAHAYAALGNGCRGEPGRYAGNAHGSRHCWWGHARSPDSQGCPKANESRNSCPTGRNHCLGWPGSKSGGAARPGDRGHSARSYGTARPPDRNCRGSTGRSDCPAGQPAG